MTFRKGQSGNPGGRKRGIERELQELLKDDLPKIAKAQGRIARGLPPEEAPHMEVKAADANRAAEWCYDRCYSKPRQVLEVEDADDQKAVTTRDVFNALDADGIAGLELAMQQIDSARASPVDEDPPPGVH